MAILKVLGIAIAAFAIALYARSHMDQGPAPRVTTQAVSVALLPTPLPITVDGTIVFDDIAGKNRQPFVLYGELKEDGTSSVKTKRLIFPAEDRYPLLAGDQVRVEGTADADIIYVRRLTVLD